VATVWWMCGLWCGGGQAVAVAGSYRGAWSRTAPPTLSDRTHTVRPDPTRPDTRPIPTFQSSVELSECLSDICPAGRGLSICCLPPPQHRQTDRRRYRDGHGDGDRSRGAHSSCDVMSRDQISPRGGRKSYVARGCLWPATWNGRC